ncbi:MAG: amino acid adenylation domain-containing protein [Clostridiales bacterium]|nr:amino acid adenylation domain-containing protein [Clostridia bacterium]MCR4882663.1 amino acid adenylation domain-containing protein [Clostridiales bacterium]
METNVLAWLEKTAERLPEKIAYQSEEGAITFRQTLEKARSIGAALASRDLGANPVAVMLDKQVDTIPAFLGVVYSGRAYAPIDASLPDARIQTILSTLNPSALLTNASNQEKAARCLSSEAPLLLVQDMYGEEDFSCLESIRRTMLETDPLYIIFTSGSSGTPKGVVTSHHALMCYIRDYAEMMDIREEDRLGNQSPLDYIAAIRDIYLPLDRGCSTYLIAKTAFMQADRLVDILNKQKITALGWSVSALTVLTSLGVPEDYTPKTIRKICFSGSVMPGAVLRKWQLGMPQTCFVNQYGPTEATASCTYYRVDHLVEENETIPIGIPYSHYRILLLNEKGEEPAPGEEGEICVSGPCLALGYWGNPDRTKRDFIQNPLNQHYDERIYRTGDIGRWGADGSLEFHGRKDRQIKHMGHRVELDEIESAALALPKVKTCAVIYDAVKEVLHLFYTGDASTREIALGLRMTLPGFMIPRKMHCLEEIPTLPNGKTDMGRLKKMAETA